MSKFVIKIKSVKQLDKLITKLQKESLVHDLSYKETGVSNTLLTTFTRIYKDMEVGSDFFVYLTNRNNSDSDTEQSDTKYVLTFATYTAEDYDIKIFHKVKDLLAILPNKGE